MTDVLLATLLDRFVRRMHVALRQKAVDFDTENVGPAGGMILLMMADLGRVPINELTARFGRDKSQMTRLVQTLERKGLVERTQSASDLRVSLVSLTDRGVEFVAELRDVISSTIDEILDPVSDEEKQLLISILQRVDP